MKIRWKNCPRALKGQYHNPKDSKLAVLSYEAVADGDLYCWHWFAGRAGTNNDLTVAANSPLLIDILSGRRRMHLPDGYVVNGVRRSWLLYFLGDSIYPRWAIYYLPEDPPASEKASHAGRWQESKRKDVERLFGCLQGRFHIMRLDRHEWSNETVQLITQVCVILHNIIVVMRRAGELDEEGALDEVNFVEEFWVPPAHEDSEEPPGAPEDQELDVIVAMLERVDAVKSEAAHQALRSALTDHLWFHRGEH